MVQFKVFSGNLGAIDNLWQIAARIKTLRTRFRQARVSARPRARSRCRCCVSETVPQSLTYNFVLVVVRFLLPWKVALTFPLIVDFSQAPAVPATRLAALAVRLREPVPTGRQIYGLNYSAVDGATGARVCCLSETCIRLSASASLGSDSGVSDLKQNGVIRSIDMTVYDVKRP
jgi:hypothetical protein